MATVAVIGGTGFLGRALAPALVAGGHVAVAIARRRPAALPAGTSFRAGDVTDAAALRAALAGCDAVVSLGGGLHESRRQSYHDVNARGLRNLVEVCRALRLRRVVHVSSLGARATARSAFLRSKHLGEETVRRSLLDVTVLRPSAIWGPGDDFVVPLARLLVRLPVAPLPGDGALRLEPVAATDVVSAVVAALAREVTVGQAYDLPGPERLTLAEIYRRVLDAVGKERRTVGVPWLVIEPLATLFRRMPGIPFSFEQLAFVEEAQPGVLAPTARDLDFAPRTFAPAAIRAALEAHVA